MTAKTVLIIRSSALGDVAMTIPVVYSVAKSYPDIRFIYLTRPFFTRLFINKPSNLKLISADFQKQYKGLIGLLKLFQKLRKQNITDVADLHNVLRSRLMDGLFKIFGRCHVSVVDKNRSGRKNLLKKHESQKNYIDRYFEVFLNLGLPATIDFGGLFPRKIRARGRKFSIGIAPFARYANKTYPVDMMRMVIEKLYAAEIEIYLFGAKGYEQSVLEKWSADFSNLIVVAGKHSLEEELAIISTLDLMVAMDSANQHLAALVGVRTLTLWGSTVPYGGFLGYHQEIDDALYLNLPCQPCSVAGSHTCKYGNFECLTKLSPFAICEKILNLKKCIEND